MMTALREALVGVGAAKLRNAVAIADAGAVNVALALVHGATLPASSSLAGAGLVGFFGYGVSLVLCIRLDLI